MHGKREGRTFLSSLKVSPTRVGPDLSFSKELPLVEHLRWEMEAPGQDLGQSWPSVSFSRGDYWKSTSLLKLAFVFLFVFDCDPPRICSSLAYI